MPFAGRHGMNIDRAYSISVSGKSIPDSSASVMRAALTRANRSVIALRVARCKLVLRRIADDLGAVAVRKNESAIIGENVRRNTRMRGEEQPVAMRAIDRPFRDPPSSPRSTI